jgi:hypothetical protein
MRLDAIREMTGLIRDVEDEFKSYAILASTKNTPLAELEIAYQNFMDASHKMIEFRNKHKPKYQNRSKEGSNTEVGRFRP